MREADNMTTNHFQSLNVDSWRRLFLCCGTEVSLTWLSSMVDLLGVRAPLLGQMVVANPQSLRWTLPRSRARVTWGQLDMCSREGRNHEEPKRTAGSSECEHSWLSCQYLFGIGRYRYRYRYRYRLEPPLQQASHNDNFQCSSWGIHISWYFIILLLLGLLGGLDSKDRSLLQRSSKCASEAWKNWFLAALAKNQSTHRDRVLFWMGWSIKTDIFVHKDWMLHDHILGLHEIPSRSRCSKRPRPITDPYPAIMVNDLTRFFHQILAHRESPGHMMDLHVDTCWKEVLGVLTQGSTRSDLYKFRLTLDTWWVLLDSPATAFLQNLYVDFRGWKKKVTRSFFLLAN